MSDSDAGGTGADDEAFESMNAELVGRGGESQVMENALEHIVTRVTDEGLVIDIFATEEQALFKSGTMDPTDLLKLIAGLNALGVAPRDMIDILKSIKAAGALHAEFIVN